MDSHAPVHILVMTTPLIFSGLQQALAKIAGIKLFHITTWGEIEPACRRAPFDVFIFSLRLAPETWQQRLIALHQRHPALKVMVLLDTDPDDYLLPLTAVGVVAYLSLDEPIERLTGAVLQAIQGGIYFSRPDILRRLIAIENAKDEPPLLATLTARERDVFNCLIQGYDNRQIGRVLNLQMQTVSNHLSNIYKKLDLVSDRQAIYWAAQQGLIQEKQEPVGN